MVWLVAYKYILVFFPSRCSVLHVVLDCKSSGLCKPRLHRAFLLIAAGTEPRRRIDLFTGLITVRVYFSDNYIYLAQNSYCSPVRKKKTQLYERRVWLINYLLCLHSFETKRVINICFANLPHGSGKGLLLRRTRSPA